MGNKWIYIHTTIGTFPNLIIVPTHFFKVLIGKRKIKGNQKGNNNNNNNKMKMVDEIVLGAFLIPNNDEVDKMVITLEINIYFFVFYFYF
jgi:hypothetical protein